ncbi:MAG TPA: hypothetical protein DEA73_00520 [Peptococcaceae bacterium]|nr:MAG: Acyltransferase 3 [Moorella sp. 60_41]HBT46356.1 hypothetical protein [Peptococcaceae bacterium]
MGKPHVGEVDYLRVFGLVTIVFIHAWGFYLLMPVEHPYTRIVQELGVNLFRFGRQVFMFITGLVLFYNYGEGKVDLRRFFSRRWKNVAIPYIIWTALYLLVKRISGMLEWNSWGSFLALWGQNVLNGNGFSHLYYILVALQFYLAFPLLVTFFKPRRPEVVAKVVIFAGLILYALYHYLFEVHGELVKSAVAGTPLAGMAEWFMLYKDRLVFSYFPYYLFGALAGLYMEKWRRWLQDHRQAVLILLFCTTAWVVGEYFYFYLYRGQSWALTISVFKPSIYLYSLTLIVFCFQKAYYLEGRGFMSGAVSFLASNSLGIYLLHPAVLYFFNSYCWEYISLFGSLLAVLEPAAVIIISAFLSALLGSSRYTRFIIGEAGDLKSAFPRGSLKGRTAAHDRLFFKTD